MYAPASVQLKGEGTESCNSPFTFRQQRKQFPPYKNPHHQKHQNKHTWNTTGDSIVFFCSLTSISRVPFLVSLKYLIVFKYAFSSFITWAPDVLKSLVRAIYFDKSPPRKVQDHSELCTSLSHIEYAYKFIWYQWCACKSTCFHGRSEHRNTKFWNKLLWNHI